MAKRLFLLLKMHIIIIIVIIALMYKGSYKSSHGVSAGQIRGSAASARLLARAHLPPAGYL